MLKTWVVLQLNIPLPLQLTQLPLKIRSRLPLKSVTKLPLFHVDPKLYPSPRILLYPPQ